MLEHFMARVEDPFDSSACQRPDINEGLTDYCFGEMTGQERERFEAHLLECDFCWGEVQRLDSTVRALRSQKETTRPLSWRALLISVFGISGKLTSKFCGHLFHSCLASLLYGALYAVALPVEIAYQWDAFGHWSIGASITLFLWIASTTLFAMWLICKAAVSGRSSGAMASASVISGAALVLYVVLRPYLPEHAITEATFQTYTAQTAYLKSIFYFLPIALIYLVLPFHFVVAMQRELQRGRSVAVQSVLTRSRSSALPRGVLYPHFSVLCAILIIATAVSIYMGAHLLENLKGQTYTNLFIHLVQVRWLLYLLLGIECLSWYYGALQEMKRECLAVQNIDASFRCVTPDH